MQKFRDLFPKTTSVFLFFLAAGPLLAQGSGTDNGNVYVISILIIIGALILISAILTLSENLIQIEAKKSGLNSDNNKLSLFSFGNLWKKPNPEYTEGQVVHQLNKGFDILLNGDAEPLIKNSEVKRFAICPPNFRGMVPIPKVIVSVGDEVKAGDVLFHDKKDATIKYVAPVSGEIVEIKRGAKRSIAEIVILADKKIKYKPFDPPSIKEASVEEIRNFLFESGGWTLINERPFDIIPGIESTPSNIFISTFNTAPLAPDMNLVVEGKEHLFQKGLDVLGRLTEGAVHLGLNANREDPPHKAFTHASGVQKHWFRGKHPSGNVGIQIHHVAPIKSGQKVWTLKVQEVIMLGELMFKGRYNSERIIALSGSKVQDPCYIKTHIGANIEELVGGAAADKDNRVIAGDVLSGRTTGPKGYLDYRCDQVTIIKEGDYFEMFGWLLPMFPRPSISKTFPNFLFPTLKFDGDTNTHGEKRAFVVTGQYESVLPMNIYPQHLMKAIMMSDFEQMEGLGIQELSEEDIALCEFACTSKIPLQKILREGLDMIREQS